ncbi:MAG: hypothetical protein ACHQ9S_25075 [Candidatus Binatia bacterium]
MADDIDLLRQLISLGSVGGGEPRGSEYTGTKALMLAVLQESIRNCCGRAGRLRTEAEVWVRSHRHAPFSFTVICETLGLEPEAVRRALPRLQRQSLPRQHRIRPNGRRHQAVGNKSE